MSGFGFGEGRPSMDISESEIRYAMENTKSAAAAARFLRVSYETFRKYATMYKDDATGKTLFELHKNPAGKGLKRVVPKNKMNGQYGLNDILEGKHPKYNRHKLKERLLRSGLYEEKCSRCGFCERRVTDYTVPLLLDWIDGDLTNHKKDNLRFLCHNCYYLEVNNSHGGRTKHI